MFLFQEDEYKSAFKNGDKKFRPDVMVSVGYDTPTGTHAGYELIKKIDEGGALGECQLMAYTRNSISAHPTLFSTDENNIIGLDELAHKAKRASSAISFYTNCSPKLTKEGRRLHSENYVPDVADDYSSSDYGWRLKVKDFPFESNIPLNYDGVTLSCLAYDEGEGNIIDLRTFIVDGELKWDAPDGNWRIYQFYCERSCDVRVNVLSYTESLAYLEKKYSEMLSKFQESILAGRSDFYFSNLQYTGINRNVWHPNFNEYFEREYGYDPAPFYLSLFSDTSAASPAVRAQFVKLRSKLLSQGFMAACADFCRRYGAEAALSQCEARMAESVWISGDPISSRVNLTPAAQMNWAYLYGINSIKIAASAALYSDSDAGVVCEMFSCSETLSCESVYRDTAVAFARGADRLIINADSLCERMTYEAGKPEFDINRYIEFVSRLTQLFSQGDDVSDIAMIYPIDSLASQSYLFFKTDETGFEYPAIIQNADYTDIVNSLTSCCGRDVTILHPDVIKNRCFVASDKLKLRSSGGLREFSVLILPSSSMISLDTVKAALEFFRGGGKVIATGELPTKASEYTPSGAKDSELKELLISLFGTEPFDTGLIRAYYENESENGGRAVYIPSDTTSLDGTYSVSGQMLSHVIGSFGVLSDVIIKGMPRVESSGLFELSLEEYLKAGYSPDVSIGGIFNYRHTRSEDTDVYFFANATNNDYNGQILIRSDKKFEEWDAESGRISRPKQTLTEIDGVSYVEIEMFLAQGKCTALLSR